MTELFKKLESELLEYLPLFFAEQSNNIAIKGEVFSLRIYFYDSHAPNFYFSIQVVSVTDRDQILKTKRPIDIPNYLFAPGERAGFELKAIIPQNPEAKAQTQLEKTCKAIQKLDVSEHEKLVLLSECLHRVCLNLNQNTYEFPVSYDFTITPADGSSFFADDAEVDIVRSVSLEKMYNLLENGYISFRNIRYEIDSENSIIKWGNTWKVFR